VCRLRKNVYDKWIQYSTVPKHIEKIRSCTYPFRFASNQIRTRQQSLASLIPTQIRRFQKKGTFVH
jgi:hypothetical protein